MPSSIVPLPGCSMMMPASGAWRPFRISTETLPSDGGTPRQESAPPLTFGTGRSACATALRVNVARRAVETSTRRGAPKAPSYRNNGAERRLYKAMAWPFVASSRRSLPVSVDADGRRSRQTTTAMSNSAASAAKARSIQCPVDSTGPVPTAAIIVGLGPCSQRDSRAKGTAGSRPRASRARLVQAGRNRTDSS